MKPATRVNHQSYNEEVFDFQEEARYVKSRQGYDIELLDDAGDILPAIKLPDDTSEFAYLKSDYLNFLDFELKHIVISFLRYIIERNQQSTVRNKVKFLDYFAMEVSRGISVQKFMDSISTSTRKSKASDISTFKEFLKFAILHEFDGLTLDAYEEFQKLRDYSGKKNSYFPLFMMDEERGPFSKEEISVLSAQVEKDSLPLVFRLILDLCLCFGLRPIQMSLLRRKDFIKDPITGVHYLNIPRVKQRSRDRRSQFSARILTERTANLLQLHIDFSFTPEDIEPGEVPIFISVKSIGLESDSNSVGGHFWGEEERVSKQYFLENSKKATIYNKSPCRINYLLWGNEHRLPLSPRTGKKFNLCAYRFRYTVGTQAVISGCTPEEVADLLDHEGTNSVKHYFRFTHEMWEILEKATLSRVEQKQFTAAWMREGDLNGNVFSQICEPKNFNVIGKCASSSVCFEEPAITCYACDRFCPNKNKNVHESALEGLIERKNLLMGVSTPNVVSVIDQSIAGCHAAIAYSEGREVILINAKEL